MTDRIIVAFDASELDNFKSCEFKWHTFNHRGIVPKTVKSYLEMGTLIHYLLEQYYKGKKENSVNIEEIVELGRVESLKFDLTLDEIGEHIFQFREYVSYYEDLENIIPVYIEQPFAVPFYEDDEIQIILQGKPDLIFRYPNSFDLIVMDHKKVTRESPISPLRNQFLLYATAIKTDTVIVNKVGFQKTKSRKDRFLRASFIYNKEILEEWKQETIADIKRMILFEQAGYYPKNRSSCEKWDGCWYQRYCATRPSARDFLIGNEYVIKESWDVGKKLEEK